MTFDPLNDVAPKPSGSYLAEAQRIGQDFAKAADLGEKLALGRQVETFLDRPAEYERRLSER